MGVTVYPVSLAPPGGVMAYAGAAAPAGWLLCDGALLLRAQYPELFQAIGTAYNVGGELATEFRLPNLKGRVVVARDAAQAEFDVLGETGGAKTHTLLQAEMPQHNHGVTVDANNFNTDYRNTNHAHNVYSRSMTTGWMDRNWNHFHTGNFPRVVYDTGNRTHAHAGGANTGSEGVSGGIYYGAVWTLDITGTDTNHLHDATHDHPSTNYASESPWPGDYNHQHNANHGHTGSSANAGSSGAHNNLQPYLVLNMIVKT